MSRGQLMTAANLWREAVQYVVGANRFIYIQFSCMLRVIHCFLANLSRNSRQFLACN